MPTGTQPTNTVAQLVENQWPRGRTERVRTKDSAEASSKAIAVREEMSKRARATAAPPGIANRQAAVIAALAAGMQAIAAEAEQATWAQMVEAETV